MIDSMDAIFTSEPDLTAQSRDIISSSLLAPAQELPTRESKMFRAKVLNIGFELAMHNPRSPSRNNEAAFAEIQAEKAQFLGRLVETLHTGSLIVDDIEDNSTVRRGGPCVHQIYGTDKALNAANWLYFSALNSLLHNSQFSEGEKLQAVTAISRVLYRAHVGQAVDIGARVDRLPRLSIPDVCRTSLDLKSGQLMGLAIQLGGLAAGASTELQSQLFSFGCRFGIVLQKLDDVGNLRFEARTSTQLSKGLEDLVLRRPSWIWWRLTASAAQPSFTENDFLDFCQAVDHLPEWQPLERVLHKTGLWHVAKANAEQELDQWQRELFATFGLESQHPLAEQINSLGGSLREAYFK